MSKDQIPSDTGSSHFLDVSGLDMGAEAPGVAADNPGSRLTRTPGERFARLYRQADSEQLSLDTRRLIRRKLVSAVEDSVGVVAIDAIREQLQGSESSAPHLELKLRHLMEAGAEWPKLKAVAWALFKSSGAPEQAGTLIELATMHGGVADAIDVIRVLERLGSSFYSEIHPKIREQLFLKLWENNENEIIDACLESLGSQAELTDSEMLYRFNKMVRQDEMVAAFLCYQANWQGLTAAAVKIGEIVAIPIDKLWISVARAAIDLGLENIADRLLQNVPKNSDHYSDVIDMFAESADRNRSIHTNRFVDQLQRKESWEQRLSYIEQLLQVVNDNPDSVERVALNGIMEDPLRFLPPAPEPWRQLSCIVAEWAHLWEFVPNLLRVFLDHAESFHLPTLELALWEGPFEAKMNRVHVDGVGSYIRGLSMIHRYAGVGPNAAPLLWHAKSIFEECSAKLGNAAFHDWDSIIASLEKWLDKTGSIDAQVMRIMKSQISLVCHSEKMTPEQIDTASETSIANHGVAVHLEKIARNKRFYEIENKIIHRKCAYYKYVNSDLNRLWYLERNNPNPDMAWRIATVLNSRGSLRKEVVSGWQVSGENRVDYPVLLPELWQVRAIMRDFGRAGSGFMADWITVMPEFQYALPQLDESVITTKMAAFSTHSDGEVVEKHLQRLAWVDCDRKSVVGNVGAVHGLILPPFLEVFPSNIWSMFCVRFADLLGCNAFSWSRQALVRSLRKITDSSGALRPYSEMPSKVAKTIKGLHPEQRSAITGIMNSARSMTDVEFQDALSILITRVALVIYQNNFQALESLRKMRAPLKIISSLEKDILSIGYSRLRARTDMLVRTKIPRSLTYLDTIITE